MRLLNRTPDAPRLADYESWSGIFYTGNASKAWRPDDITESPSQTDDRIYTAFDPSGAAGEPNKLYRRKESTLETVFNETRNRVSAAALNKSDWTDSSYAYSDGFLFQPNNSTKANELNSFAAYNPAANTPPASAHNSKLKILRDSLLILI